MKLETKGITYSIDGKLIIEGIDISVKEGEFVGIVGPNGCGKSTLLKNIYKVFTPDSGAAFIDGEDLSKLSNRKTAKKMSVMQQENIGLIMDVPLEVTVELGRTNKTIKEILDFSPGTIIELNKLAGEAIDLLVNGKYVAKGEVVVIEDNFGIRITEIIK